MKSKGYRQPAVGLFGLGTVALMVIVLGFFPGKAEALTTTITAITFGLPFLIVATMWWDGWPFRALSRGAAGWARFGLLLVLTLVMTGVGQAITGRLDIAGIFGDQASFGIFPYGFVLAAGVFVATLQLTFVTGKAPFHRLPPVAAGFAALATAWGLGLAQYFLLLNWSGGPGTPPAPPASGGGPVYALDWPPILLCIVVLQLVFFVLLKGFPFTGIRNSWFRFMLVNVFTIVGGIVLHAALAALGPDDNQISAIAGAITAAVILIEVLFDGWPFHKAGTGVDRFGRLAMCSLLSAVLYVGLLAAGSVGYPDAPGSPPVHLWVAGVCLNLVAGFAIVHVAVFGRWPFAVQAAEDVAAERQDQAVPSDGVGESVRAIG